MDLKKIKKNLDTESMVHLFLAILLIIFYIICTMKLPEWVQLGVLLLMAFIGGIDVGYRLTKI